MNKETHPYLIRFKTSITQKVQDIDYLKGLKVQDIDNPIHDINHLIPSIKQLIKGVSDATRTQKNSY